MKKTSMIALAIMTSAGCAVVDIPPEHLAHSEASIRGAEELGADGVPAAQLHVQYAKDETAAAKSLAAGGDERAVVMLARAESDAELALGLAREAQVHADALKAANDLKALQDRAAR